MLSIIIPTLNEEENLPKLLESIKKQEGVELETIVVDAQSTDRTREIAKKYGARVIDGGLPATARNLGAAAAMGDILLFLDADVVLPAPDFLEKTSAEFRERKFGIATCAVCPISDKKIDKLFHNTYNLYAKIVRRLTPRAPGFCIFARKDIHEAIGGFDEAIKLAEDHDYAERAGKITRFGILKSYPIMVSVRRFERDGRLNVAAKYLLCEVHLKLKGPVKSDIFKYRFGYTPLEVRQKKFIKNFFSKKSKFKDN
ncbi:MAG: glycosyltransferase [Patescibacteria group bacterium]